MSLSVPKCWFELFGAGERIAPTRKQATSKREIRQFNAEEGPKVVLGEDNKL